jgi:hypothetical protein
MTVQYGDHLGAMYVRVTDQMAVSAVYGDEARQLIRSIASRGLAEPPVTAVRHQREPCRNT